MKVLFRLFVALLMLSGVPSLRADSEEEIETYSCQLSLRDHQGNDGSKLTDPAAILRQDRENFHRAGKRDKEDEPDKYFADELHRAEISELLKKGNTKPAIYRAIKTGTPLVDVYLYRKGGVLRMRVDINND